MKRHDELERLRELSDDDLREETARLKESMFRLNFKLAIGDMDAVKRIRNEKRTYARIKTLTRERAKFGGAVTFD